MDNVLESGQKISGPEKRGHRESYKGTSERNFCPIGLRRLEQALSYLRHEQSNALSHRLICILRGLFQRCKAARPSRPDARRSRLVTLGVPHITVGTNLRLAVFMKLRVVAADDNPAILHKLVSLLVAEFDLVATAENGQLALECIRIHLPDVVVLDLEMPFLNGLEITRELKKLDPSPAVVICSVESDSAIIEAAQQAGALGYVFKMHMGRDLVKAVESAAHGESFVSSP